MSKMTFKVWSEILQRCHIQLQFTTKMCWLQCETSRSSTGRLPEVINHFISMIQPFHQHFDSFWTTPSICIPYRHLRQKPSSGFFRTLRPPQKMQKTPGITPACSSRPQAEQPPSSRELPIQWQCTLPFTSLVSR